MREGSLVITGPVSATRLTFPALGVGLKPALHMTSSFENEITSPGMSARTQLVI